MGRALAIGYEAVLLSANVKDVVSEKDTLAKTELCTWQYADCIEVGWGFSAPE
jgi:hypothetical protein